MIISDLHYLEDVVEATAIAGGSEYDVSSIIEWANNLIGDLDNNLKTQKISTQNGNSASKVGRIEKKVEKQVPGGYAVAYSSVDYSVS